MNTLPYIHLDSVVSRPCSCSLPSTTDGGPSGDVSREQWLANLLQRLTQGFQPMGVLILVTVYTYFMGVCFLPPAAGVESLDTAEK